MNAMNAMNAMMSMIKYNAKDRLVSAIEEFIDDCNRNGGVASQLNRNVAYEVLDEIKALNRVKAYKLEKVIMSIEYYDPAKDKFKFGPRLVCPVDYAAFIEDI